jgi:3-oxoacyl-(acyl-carrier-protein) synthase
MHLPIVLLQACKSEQLEQVVQQMCSDLQRATQLLEHTGGAVQEQTVINQQLQQQVQQVRGCTQPVRSIASACAAGLVRICDGAACI